MDFHLLKAFIEVCESGSLSESARRRGVTRSQASRELKALEAQLGTTLIQRSTRRLSPTEQGRALHEHGLRILDECRAAEAAVDSIGRTATGHVRLSIPTGLGSVVLQPLLMDFVHRHPGIALRVLFSNRVFDLLDAEIDVAVRVTTAMPQDQVAQPVCAVAWGLYAAPAYLNSMPAPERPADLKRAAMVCPPYPGRLFVLRLQGDDGAHTVELAPRVQSEHFPFLLDAVRAGTGIGLLPRYAVGADLASGTLLPVLPQWQPVGLGDRLYILTMPNRHPSHATRRLIEFLRAGLEPLSASGYLVPNNLSPASPSPGTM